jgi:hypothetical protein
MSCRWPGCAAVGEYEQAVRRCNRPSTSGRSVSAVAHPRVAVAYVGLFRRDKWDEAAASFQEFLKTRDGYGRIYQTFIGELSF